VRGLDTNVLLRFLLGDDDKQAAAARNAIDRAREKGEPFIVSLMTLIEAEWVLRTVGKLEKARVIHEIKQLLEVEGVVLEDELAVAWALRLYETSNADFAECLMLARYQRIGCSTMLTFDVRAAKLPSCELLV
jgi:predicted nucleic-acid-binding protein